MPCPYIEDPDEECAARLKMERIEEVLAICGDSFTDCPHYRQRIHETKDQDIEVQIS